MRPVRSGTERRGGDLDGGTILAMGGEVVRWDRRWHRNRLGCSPNLPRSWSSSRDLPPSERATWSDPFHRSGEVRIMARKRYSAEQIIRKLREAEVELVWCNRCRRCA